MEQTNLLQNKRISMLGELTFDKIVRKGSGLSIFEAIVALFIIFVGFNLYLDTSIALITKISAIFLLTSTATIFIFNLGTDLKTYQYAMVIFNYLFKSPKLYQKERPQIWKQFEGNGMLETLTIDMTGNVEIKKDKIKRVVEQNEIVDNNTHITSNIEEKTFVQKPKDNFSNLRKIKRISSGN